MTSAGFSLSASRGTLARREQVPDTRPYLTSMAKVGHHREKVRAFLNGEPIFPVTLEMDLTSACTKTCADCPSTTAPQHNSLTEDFLDRLLGCLGGRATGLLLTGGEPTMAPLFPRALQMARARGFVEIAVVTNGSLLHRPEIQDALLQHVTTIRLSLYGWGNGDCSEMTESLEKIEKLRGRIDREGSRLQIGVSALTSSDRAGELVEVAGLARRAGAHWIYFHPLCRNWTRGHPSPVGQVHVLDEIQRLQAGESADFCAYVFRDRYETTELEFNGYHAAHFLLVVGADARNYLAPEVKYQASHVIAELGNSWRDDFLWDQARLDRIASISSRTYAAIRSRHRGELYSHFLEALKRGDPAAGSLQETESAGGFRFPHIL